MHLNGSQPGCQAPGPGTGHEVAVRPVHSGMRSSQRHVGDTCGSANPRRAVTVITQEYIVPGSQMLRLQEWQCLGTQRGPQASGGWTLRGSGLAERSPSDSRPPESTPRSRVGARRGPAIPNTARGCRHRQAPRATVSPIGDTREAGGEGCTPSRGPPNGSGGKHGVTTGARRERTSSGCNCAPSVASTRTVGIAPRPAARRSWVRRSSRPGDLRRLMQSITSPGGVFIAFWTLGHQNGAWPSCVSTWRPQRRAGAM
jgi:hypothetical protein